MADQAKMSRQQMLEAIAEAVRRRQAGEDPYSDPNLKQMLPRHEFVSPDITPERPDPERDANRAIDAATSGRSSQMQQMMNARKANGINPETGMPHYNAPEAAAEPAQGENPQDAERRQIRMQLLQEAAKTGRMPEYLKKQ